jgi:hypothetical protein
VFTADKGGVLRPSNFRVKVWLRERLDAMHVLGLQAIPAATVVELPAAPARPLAAPARPTADQATKKTRRATGPGLG